MNAKKQEQKLEKFNSQKVIKRIRNWVNKNQADLDHDMQVRMIRSLNYQKVAEVLPAEHQASKFLNLWAAVNNVYSDVSKLEQNKTNRTPEQKIMKDRVTQLVRLDKNFAKANDGLNRKPFCSWKKLILTTYADECKALLGCPWLYKESQFTQPQQKVTKKSYGKNKKVRKPILTLWEQREQEATQCTTRFNPNSTLALHQTLDKTYNLRNYLVHGSIDPHSKFLRNELQAACIFTQAILALLLQVMVEHPTRKWPGVQFGKQDNKPYVPVLRLDSEAV